MRWKQHESCQMAEEHVDGATVRLKVWGDVHGWTAQISLSKKKTATKFYAHADTEHAIKVACTKFLRMMRAA